VEIGYVEQKQGQLSVIYLQTMNYLPVLLRAEKAADLRSIWEIKSPWYWWVLGA